MTAQEREPARTGDNVSDVIQAAALEAIKAIRALLDVAEAVVREPGTAAVVGKAFAEAATAVFRPSTPGDDEPAEHDGDTSTVMHQGVRRIHLSD